MVSKTPVSQGYKFGLLTYIQDGTPSITYNKNGTIKQHRRTAICLCSCGKIKEYIFSRLVNGQTTSCGCYRKIAYRKHDSTEHFDAGFLSCVKYDASRRDMCVEITVQDLEDQYMKQNGLCFYTKRPLAKIAKQKKRGVSVDRLDNTKGYTKDNIVLCIPIINVMKYTSTYEDFVSLCRDVIQIFDSR